jgi:hypothetical protein
VRAIEALWAMTEGEKVALYWPDCEMFKWVGPDSIGIFTPDYSDLEANTMTSSEFLRYYPTLEFVLYEENK